MQILFHLPDKEWKNTCYVTKAKDRVVCVPH